MGSESVVAVLFWVVAAVVMRFEMSRVFEIQRLLPLPVQFRALYALRVGAGLSGLWIPLFGPSLLYLLVVRTAGPAGFAVAVLAAVLWAWQRVGWPGLGMFGLWLALPFCLLVAGDGFGAYASVRWPYKLDFSLHMFQLPPGPVLLAWLPVAAGAIGVPFGLEFLLENRSWGPRLAVYGAIALMIGAVALRHLLVRSADRRVRADPHRILDLLANRKDEVREAA